MWKQGWLAILLSCYYSSWSAPGITTPSREKAHLYASVTCSSNVGPLHLIPFKPPRLTSFYPSLSLSHLQNIIIASAGSSFVNLSPTNSSYTQINPWLAASHTCATMLHRPISLSLPLSGGIYVSSSSLLISPRPSPPCWNILVHTWDYLSRTSLPSSSVHKFKCNYYVRGSTLTSSDPLASGDPIRFSVASISRCSLSWINCHKIRYITGNTPCTKYQILSFSLKVLIPSCPDVLSSCPFPCGVGVIGLPF